MTKRKPSKPTPHAATQRMASYRERMRASGLRPVQLWVPDTRDPAFVERYRRQVETIAASDPAHDDLMAFVEAVYEWPDP